MTHQHQVHDAIAVEHRAPRPEIRRTAIGRFHGRVDEELRRQRLPSAARREAITDLYWAP
jgi:hypothetical protein